MHATRLLYTILCTFFVSFAISAPHKRPSRRKQASSSKQTLSKKEQQRLSLERARIRDSIRKQFYAASKKPSSKPIQKKPPVRKKPQKKAPAKKQVKKPIKKAVPKKPVAKKKPVPKKKAPSKPRAPQRKSAPKRKPVKRTSKPRKKQIRRPGTRRPKKKLSAHQRLILLRKMINKLAHEADKNTSIGVKVVLLKNNSTVYQKNANKLFKPASNTKLITAAAAYHILGPQYTFKTTLFTDRKINSKTINNLYIRGSGDPTLHEKDLTKLAKRLAGRGITEIKGNIIVDHTIFNNQGTGPGWRTGDGAIFDKAPTSGLMVNHSCVRVHVKPTRVVGRKPIVSISPSTRYIRLDNQARTRGKTKGKSLHVLRGKGNKIIVKGAISKRSKQKSYRISVQHPSRFAGHVFRTVLRKNGITVKGTVTSGKVPKNGQYLAQHSSKNLSGIIRYMMKASDNLYADAIFRAMGAHMYGTPGTWTKGKRAVEGFLRNKVGINTKELKINDGSGLSHKNQVSPNHLIKLLTWEYTQSPHKKSFIASLPIGGVDGTLRNRMKHRSIRAAVKAKTGSLSGVTSLSGYITPKTGLPLIFVIMVNRKNKSAVTFKRKLEDQLCKLLAAHAFSTS